MDERLKRRLEKIEAHIPVLYAAEERYLTLDAAKDHTLAVLMKTSQASSQSAKETDAKASEPWRTFIQCLAIAEAQFHRERHVLDLKLKAYDAEHLTLKVESPVIKRQL